MKFLQNLSQVRIKQAIDQISDKNYTLPFELDGQQIIRLGINFDKETRNIDEVLIG